ncbi:MAG: hypothetical protein HYZ14_05430 [Bacteroidetes bacterium]|nr:hypothetical protein [Bacteroidota bacterium]
MKKLALLSVLLLNVVIHSFAQDKVLLKNGTVIQAKVLEVGAEEVKYQLYTKTGDGAIYVVPKSKIELIEFENGYREEFKDITNEMADLSKNHLIGFNYIDLLARNVSFDYEYFFPKRDFSIYVPLRVGLDYSLYSHYTANVIETGVGLFAYPYRRKKLNFFTGAEFMYSNKFSYGSTYDQYGNYTWQKVNRNYLGVYTTAGIKLNFRERFGLGYSLSVGIMNPLEGGGADIMAKGNMSFFYRF